MPSETQAFAERALVMPWERRDRPALRGAWWARGLRLDERCAVGYPGAEAVEGDDVTLIADVRWERWHTAFAHLADDVLERQIADYGCTPNGLRKLLAEPPEHLGQRVAKPAWAADVERVAGALPREPSLLPETDRDGGWHRGFALILDPFVQETLRLFDERAGSFDAAEVVDLDAFRDEVRRGAARRLVAQASRVLVLELNVLRVLKRLEGVSPEDRFWSFVEHYRRRAAFAELLDEYAVLARLLVTTASQVAEVYAEFLERFVRDREDMVQHLFSGVDPGILRVVELSKGDTHHRGRSVGIARFGSGRRVVYKPRPLGVHRRFNEVLEWFNERVPAFDALKPLALVDRDDYGWVEHVEPSPCQDTDAAARYFHRQGALLAILHALGGVDFHFENLVAVGDQPVPVDLESLFCADLPRSFGSEVVDRDPAMAAYLEAVNRVGLLPSVLIGDDGQAFDLGGMGGDRDAVMPFRAVDWQGAGTDEMSLGRVQPRLGGTHNRPSLDGVDLDAVHYAAPLLAGYGEAYRVIAAGRAELAGADGPLAGFYGERVRIIPRSTREYFVLLNESTHPDAMRDALDRDQIFGVLWARSAGDSRRSRLIRHEVEDLWAGDVPLFTAVAESRDVRASSGAVVEAVLPETGVARVERLLAGMGERHRARQEWIVSAHLVTRTTGTELTAADADRQAASAADVALPDRALAAARTVADQLEAAAYRDGRRIGWLGLDLVRDTRWQVTPVSMDLYGGLPGIALFFAQLADVTGEDRYAALARDVFGSVTDFAYEQLDRPVAPIGAFTGLSGMALALASGAVLLGDTDLAAPVAPLLRCVADRISDADGFDVIAGAAGCLAVAEALAVDSGALAERCVEVLHAGAVEVGDGLAWPAIGERPLLGFSHGASGIAWALWSYAQRTGDEKARTSAIRALAYERAEYDERTGNWPDWREAEPVDQYTWCHGAPGVGLARAAMAAEHPRRTLPATSANPESLALRDDLRRALAATERFGAYSNHSLCHGELGNLDLFATAAPAASAASASGATSTAPTATAPALPADEARRLRHVWQDRATAAVAEIERTGPLCGAPAGIATPGLMTGLAGIGHGLLRVAAPDRIPPILLLALPRRASPPHHPEGNQR